MRALILLSWFCAAGWAQSDFDDHHYGSRYFPPHARYLPAKAFTYIPSPLPLPSPQYVSPSSLLATQPPGNHEGHGGITHTDGEHVDFDHSDVASHGDVAHTGVSHEHGEYDHADVAHGNFVHDDVLDNTILDKETEPEVYKHVYVHQAPEEPTEPPKPTVIKAHRTPKKHYKIVFIKAPTPAPPTPAVVNLPPPDEEKTLIYVLSAKQKEATPVVVKSPPPKHPAKPEVFFIRYKTERDHAEGKRYGDGHGAHLSPSTTQTPLLEKSDEPVNNATELIA